MFLVCTMLLTVSQEVEQHFHLRQGVDTDEVCPVRATGPGWILPASCFCFWQQPVAETIMRPPAFSTLCMDILPARCKEGGKIRTRQTRVGFTTQIHSRHCFGPAANSATDREVKVHSPGAVQLWRPRAPKKASKKASHKFCTDSLFEPATGHDSSIDAGREPACQVFLQRVCTCSHPVARLSGCH